MVPCTQEGEDAKSRRRRTLIGEETAKEDTVQSPTSVDAPPYIPPIKGLEASTTSEGNNAQAPTSMDAPPYIPPIKGLEASTTSEGNNAQAPTSMDAPPYIPPIKKGSILESSTDGSMDADPETVEPSPDVPWYDLRTPLDSAAVNVDSGVAAQPWMDAPTSLTLQAEKPIRPAVGAGQQLEALAGSDQLHLLVGGSLLLVAGVVVNFVRRARKRSAAEKTLEDDTYYLMAQP